jgi:DNA-binding GntR family transcriptional regulator
MARRITTVPSEAYRVLHEKLLTALEGRDAAAACSAMGAHYRELDLDFANVIFGAKGAAPGIR